MPRLSLRPLLTLLCLGPLAATPAGPASRPSSAGCDRAPAAVDDTFRFINRGDIFTLDLNQMSYEQDFRLTSAIREGLMSPTGPDFSPEPAGASGVDVSADRRVYTFHLRPEARWSNGDPLVAADYLFSWKLMLDAPGEYTYLFYGIDGAEAYKAAVEAGRPADFASVGASAPDPHTLRVTLARPVTYFLDLVGFAPFFPRHEPSMRKFRRDDGGHVSYDNRYTRPPDVVTNGPFVLRDWQFKRVLRLDRSDTYWDRAGVKLAHVDNVVNNNTLSQYLQFEAGAADWVCEVPPEIAPELRSQNRPGFQTATAFGTAFLSLNCRADLASLPKNPLADVRVRQALALSADKAFITQGITRMGERVADTFVPPGTLRGYTSLPGLGHDVDTAKALLADAGYPGGRGFPKLPILYNSENENRARIAQALKQQWQQTLGIDVEIEGIEGKIFHQRVSAKQYLIATVAWYGDYPDASTFTDKYLSTSLQNDSDWNNPDYDALLAAASKEGDVPKRLNLLRRAEEMLDTQVPIIPLYHYVNGTLIGPRVRGVAVNSRNLVDWKRVSLAEPAATP